jgi:hypothetical protein
LPADNLGYLSSYAKTTRKTVDTSFFPRNDPARNAESASAAASRPPAPPATYSYKLTRGAGGRKSTAAAQSRSARKQHSAAKTPQPRHSLPGTATTGSTATTAGGASSKESGSVAGGARRAAQAGAMVQKQASNREL